MITHNRLSDLDREELSEQLHPLIEPSYEDGWPLIRREVEQATDLYRLWESGDIHSFFLVAWHELEVEGRQRPAVYMGLSATDSSAKNTGRVRGLYARFIVDARRREDQLGMNVICWGTAATPSSVHAVQTLWTGAEPGVAGAYTEEGAQIARAIRRYKGAERAASEHPFVLKNEAPSTRYSTVERQRIDAVKEKHNFTLLDDLGVDEACGDRLLLVASLPGTVV
ncbi:hypothetical protein CRI94_04415 [Longibacter salinarum]|uniref:GNAT family N-acetyltransferase n=1 Tax=Longibacter salinarum TaxID=1850348 RepID=A0A2A8D0W3_9BACT|nr:hypothetical protein [Longibacter salinarum]PEN14288.1 hypothetical protein CRI94_04415 [Longibacter salinarum]